MTTLKWMPGLLVLAVTAAGCSAPGGRVAEMTSPPSLATPRAGFAKRVLDNGLTILCQENHAAPIAVVQATVRAGSIFEQEYMGAGISHFCEHLVSGGTTKTRPEKETEKILDALGGVTNAYTSTDRTAYYIRTTKGENFDTALQLIADWMQNAAIKQEEYDRERKVIQREIEKGLTEHDRVLWRLAEKTMFSFHPARHPVIGYKDLFLKLTRDDVVKYYRRMYTPDNMVVVAVGDFDAAKIADRIADLFKDAKPSGRVTVVPRDDPPQQGMRRAETEMDVKGAYVAMSFRTVPLSHPDLYPLDVMSYVLSKGRSSRLVQRLREEQQLVDSVTSWSYTPWYGTGHLGIQMVVKPENIEQAKAAVLAELEKLKRDLVTEAELARAKKQKIAADVFYNQTIQAQAAELAGNFLSTGNPFFNEVYLRGIRTVKAEEIREMARKYISKDNLTVAIVRPKRTTKTGPAARSLPPSKTAKTVLPNGLRVLVKRNPNAPLVTIQAYFLGGVLAEDEKTAGTSHVLGRMLTRGTKTRTALDISKAFDDMAGSISGGSGNHTFFLKADVLAEDFESGFALFADCLLNPAFPPSELDKAKKRTLNAIARQNDSLYQEGYQLLRRTLFRVSPYRLNRLGTPDSVKAMTSGTLAAYHRRACTGPNGVVAIFGDVDVEKAKRLAAKLLGGLPPGKGATADVPVDKPLTKDVRASKRSGKPGTALVYAAYPTCKMTDRKDRYALLVLDGVMSGISLPGGWLHGELRGKGLVYVVHAYSFLGLRSPGYFGIYAMTPPDKVDEVVRIYDKNVERAKSGLVPEDEFERAKKMAITVELLGRQTNAALAATAALDELYGLGYDGSEEFAEQVNAVTRQDVLRVARKYLTRRALVVVSPALKKP